MTTRTGPRAGSAAGGRLDGTLRAFAVRHGWEVRRVMSEDFVQLGSNVYKVVAGTEPDHLAAARALLAGGGLIGAETEASARDDYRSSLASYAPEEGVPPESEAVVALRKQVTVTLSAMAVERDALLAALRGAQANERRALARVAELEAIYEPHGATLAVALNGYLIILLIKNLNYPMLKIKQIKEPIFQNQSSNILMNNMIQL